MLLQIQSCAMCTKNEEFATVLSIAPFLTSSLFHHHFIYQSYILSNPTRSCLHQERIECNISPWVYPCHTKASFRRFLSPPPPLPQPIITVIKTIILDVPRIPLSPLLLFRPLHPFNSLYLTPLPTPPFTLLFTNSTQETYHQPLTPSQRRTLAA